MKIRSITLFVEPSIDPARAAAFFHEVGQLFANQVQSLRLATTPFPNWWDHQRFTPRQAEESLARWRQVGADFVCLGPVLLRHDAGWLDTLPDIVGAGHGLLHVSAEVADTNGHVDVGRCWAVAEIIRRLSILSADGSGNFCFAALANCAGGSPYFPGTYHRGGSPRFAIAVEAADLVLECFSAAGTLMAAQERLVQAIERATQDLVVAAGQLARETGIAFAGIDFSPAPALPPGKGLSEALEALDLGQAGGPGTLFAAALVADAIGRADFPRCGFSGLMFPVLEDDRLARRAAAGHLTVHDLLAYAAVCGAGLDTVPLPGDVSHETLAAILLDVAALAVRLDKPLTARLMPMPGLSAGDPVALDLPQLIEGRVMDVAPNEGGTGLRQVTRLQLSPYHARGDW